MIEQKDLPANIHAYIEQFDKALTEEEFGSQKYAYRILFVPKTANRKGQADRVIEFVKSDSPLAESVNREYAIIKETEKKKSLPKQIVELMQAEGFIKFKLHHHTDLWQGLGARDISKGYGCMVAGKQWHWYENWVEIVRNHCQTNRETYV